MKVRVFSVKRVFLFIIYLLLVNLVFAQPWDLEKRRNLKADESKTIIFKNEKDGKYGIIFFFNDYVGRNVSGTPTRVAMSADGKNWTDITNSCSYWEKMIIVPPTIKLSDPDDFISIGVGSYDALNALHCFAGWEYIGSGFNFPWMEKEVPEKEKTAIKNYDKYAQLIDAYVQAVALTMGVSVPSYSTQGSSSSGSSTTGGSSTYTEPCSRCGGKGRVIASGVSFSSDNKWCSECNQTVASSHYHTPCTACGGSGQRTRTR